MINDSDLNYVHEQGVLGHALCWVIDGSCLYDLPLNEIYANIFLSSDQVEDVSSEYPDLPGVTVRFYKENNIIEDLNTTEYFASILLSPHNVINLHGHEYGIYVTSPNANFLDNKFIILNRNIEELNAQEGFIEGIPKKVCNESNCHCYKVGNNV